MVRLLRTKFWAELHRRGEFTVDPLGGALFAVRRRRSRAPTGAASAQGLQVLIASTAMPDLFLFLRSLLGSPGSNYLGKIF